MFRFLLLLVLVLVLVLLLLLLLMAPGAADVADCAPPAAAAAASPTPPAPTDAAALETSKAPAAADRTEALALGPYAWPSNEKADADREDEGSSEMWRRLPTGLLASEPSGDRGGIARGVYEEADDADDDDDTDDIESPRIGDEVPAMPTSSPPVERWRSRLSSRKEVRACMRSTQRT